MPDINEWRLAYANREIDFGLLATDFPFETQVDIGTPNATTQDNPHPTSDGEIFGRDSLGGFNLTYSLTTVPDYPRPYDPWNSALDLFGAFSAMWRADPIRRTPGEVATMTNLERNRLVYGRPRRIAQNLSALRQGRISYLADFRTNGPDWYSATEKAVLITPQPPAGGGFQTPLRAPFSTAIVGAELADANNEGDLEAWPVIDVHGPAKRATVDLFQGTTLMWSLSIPDGLGNNEVVRIDTRPWRRSATSGLKPANGRLRGTPLERCTLPPGPFRFRYKVRDATGTSFIAARWRDTYASL